MQKLWVCKSLKIRSIIEEKLNMNLNLLSKIDSFLDVFFSIRSKFPDSFLKYQVFNKVHSFL